MFYGWFSIRDPYLIVQNGQLAGMGAHSYSKGSSPQVPKKQQITRNKERYQASVC